MQSIDFVFPCVALNCPNNDKQLRWTHEDCGGYEKLNLNGKITCKKCYKTWDFVGKLINNEPNNSIHSANFFTNDGCDFMTIDTNFRCSKHNMYQKTDIKTLSSCVMRKMMGGNDTMFWARVVNAIKQQYDNNDSDSD